MPDGRLPDEGPSELCGPYSIGQGHWPGLGKLVEELGELQQVLGKIVAAGGKVRTSTTRIRAKLQDVHLPEPVDADSADKTFEAELVSDRMKKVKGLSAASLPPLRTVNVLIMPHQDGTELLYRLRSELADVLAAIDFLRDNNSALSRGMMRDVSGDLMSGGEYIDERAEAKFNQFSRWHDEHYRDGQWVPVDEAAGDQKSLEDRLEQRRTDFVQKLIAEHGIARTIVDRADSPAPQNEEYGRVVAEGYAADLGEPVPQGEIVDDKP